MDYESRPRRRHTVTRRFPRSLLLSFLLSLGSVFGGWLIEAAAQDKEEALEQLKTIAGRTTEYLSAVPQWERNATIIIILIIVVGSIGAVISILQGFTNKACKIACMVMGVLVSVITLVNSNYFPADHRTFGYSALKGRPMLSELRTLVPEHPEALPEGVLQARVNKGLALIRRLETLEDGIYRTWAQAVVEKAPAKALVANAYAEDQREGSISSDPRRLVYVAIGEADSVDQARETALTLAALQAAEAVAAYWSRGVKGRVDSYAVRPFIERVADLANEDVTVIKRTGLIQCRVQLSVGREFTREHWAVSFGALPRPVPLKSGDRVLLQVVQAPRGQDIQAPRGQDVQAPRAQDVQAPRGQDTQAPRGQDVQAPRGQDVQAPRGQDVQAPRSQTAPASPRPEDVRSGFLTVASGEVRTGSGASQATSFTLIGAVESAGDGDIADGGSVRMALGRSGVVGIGLQRGLMAGTGEPVAFILRRTSPSKRDDFGKGSPLRDGDLVDFSSSRGTLALLGDRVVLGDRGRGVLVVMITRVARLARDWK